MRARDLRLAGPRGPEVWKNRCKDTLAGPLDGDDRQRAPRHVAPFPPYRRHRVFENRTWLTLFDQIRPRSHPASGLLSAFRDNGYAFNYQVVTAAGPIFVPLQRQQLDIFHRRRLRPGVTLLIVFINFYLSFYGFSETWHSNCFIHGRACAWCCQEPWIAGVVVIAFTANRVILVQASGRVRLF